MSVTIMLSTSLTGLLGCASAQALTEAADARVEVVRGHHDCELFLARRVDDKVVLDVYHAPHKLSRVPSRIDAGQLRRELGVPSVELNDPRCFLFDNLTGDARPVDPTPRRAGGLPMFLAARLITQDLRADPYLEREVERAATFVFDAGKVVYELVDPDGRVWVMQSCRAPFDEAQMMESLAGLGSRLQLPQGWTFRTRTLTEELRVVAVDGVARVTTDELRNTYQLSHA